MDNQKTKKNYSGIWLFIIVVVGLVGYSIGRHQGGGGGTIVSPPTNQSSSPAGQPDQIKTYDYTEAPNHIGEYAAIQGKVVKVFQSSKGTVFFDYNYDYRKSPFSAVIFASSVGNFGNLFQYEGKTVKVTGIIKTYQDRAEIILENPSQISQ